MLRADASHAPGGSPIPGEAWLETTGSVRGMTISALGEAHTGGSPGEGLPAAIRD